MLSTLKLVLFWFKLKELDEMCGPEVEGTSSSSDPPASDLTGAESGSWIDYGR